MHHTLAVISILPASLLASAAHGLEGAHWIGAPSYDLPVNPEFLPVFKIDFDISLDRNSHASLIYGADDPRLMDRNMNIFGLAAKPGESFISLRIDGGGTVSVFRKGYHPDDSEKPVAVIGNVKLRNGRNHFTVVSVLGTTEIFLNGASLGKILLNPVENGGDYTAFPVLGKMAASIPEKQTAVIENIRISNFREPSAVLYGVPGIFRKSAEIRIPVKSLPELRTNISVGSLDKIEKATVRATARGIYDMKINGKRVTDGYFFPGCTQYNRTHLFHDFDISTLLKPGNNVITVQLAEGWWSGGATFIGENWNFFGDRQSFLAKTTIEYTDGTVEEYPTSPRTWQYSVDGPLIGGSFFQGEIMDASRSAGQRRDWKQAVEIPLENTVCTSVGSWDNIRLIPSFGDRVLAVDTLTAVSVMEPRPGVYVYDMGQNMAGVPHITFQGLDKGQDISIRYSEILYPDMPEYSANTGMVMTENLMAAMCRDVYKASGQAGQVFSPRFTLHGYRYIELTGLDAPLPLESVRSIPLSSISGFKAGFRCSDSLVNRLWKNICWSALSNFISIPTDCPQRNERLGWMGDISVFAPTATKIADVHPILSQYLNSVRDCQEENGRFPDVAPTGFGFGGLLWGSAGITVPWELFRQYGDTTLLKEHYPAMKKYIEYILKETIDPETDIIVQDRAWGDLADWLSPEYEKPTSLCYGSVISYMISALWKKSRLFSI